MNQEVIENVKCIIRRNKNYVTNENGEKVKLKNIESINTSNIDKILEIIPSLYYEGLIIQEDNVIESKFYDERNFIKALKEIIYNEVGNLEEIDIIKLINLKENNEHPDLKNKVSEWLTQELKYKDCEDPNDIGNSTISSTKKNKKISSTPSFYSVFNTRNNTKKVVPLSQIAGKQKTKTKKQKTKTKKQKTKNKKQKTKNKK